MALWFLRGLRRGVLTTRYPAGVDAWASSLPSPPTFDPARLTLEAVGRMVVACPADALQTDGRELVVDLGACCGCGNCGAVAPDVVRPSGVWELATGDRRHLIKRLPIRGAGE